MSSDNYYQVWRRNGKFYVSMEFMSDETVKFDPECAREFDTLDEAIEYAGSEYSEYGIFVEGEDT